MPLMTPRPMLELAQDGGFAVGAFNVSNMELTQAVIEACAKEKAPVILQVSKGISRYAKFRYLKAIIEAALQEHPELPIAIQADHCDTLDFAKACIDEGYSGVMIDGSASSFDKNVALTRDVVTAAHEAGVTVEAELGAKAEETPLSLEAADADADPQWDKYTTRPEQAQDFVRQSGCDFLAVAVGTSHGAYKHKLDPTLLLDRIASLSAAIPGVPLVLHGASSLPAIVIDTINDNGGRLAQIKGIPEELIAQAARNTTVSKVNIDTDLRLAIMAKVREVLYTKPHEIDPRAFLAPGREAAMTMVRLKLELLNCAGKAPEVLKHWEEQGQPTPRFYEKSIMSFSSASVSAPLAEPFAAAAVVEAPPEPPRVVPPPIKPKRPALEDSQSLIPLTIDPDLDDTGMSAGKVRP